MTTPENPLGSVFAETSGELSQADQDAKDAAIMAGLHARRAAEKAAEAAAQPQVEAATAETRRMLDSYDFSDNRNAEVQNVKRLDQRGA